MSFWSPGVVPFQIALPRLSKQDSRFVRQLGREFPQPSHVYIYIYYIYIYIDTPSYCIIGMPGTYSRGSSPENLVRTCRPVNRKRKANTGALWLEFSGLWHSFEPKSSPTDTTYMYNYNVQNLLKNVCIDTTKITCHAFLSAAACYNANVMAVQGPESIPSDHLSALREQWRDPPAIFVGNMMENDLLYIKYHYTYLFMINQL